MTNIQRQRGLSLVEMMIAMTLGLMITGTIGYLFVGSRTTYRSQDANARVQDTGRFVMDFIGRQIQMAGRTEITPLSADGGVAFNGAPLAGSDGIEIEGQDALQDNELTYKVSGGGTQTRFVDQLEVRYQLSTLGGGTIADCNGFGGNSDNTPDDAGIGGLSASRVPIVGTSPVKRIGTVVNVIALDQSSRPAPARTAGIWELDCWGNGGLVQPIAEGVEDLQFRYGLDTNNDATVDQWISTTPTSAQQAQIIAVEACILVHSLDNGAVPAPMRVTDCSGTTYTANDLLLYRTFRQVFTLRNRINATP